MKRNTKLSSTFTAPYGKATANLKEVVKPVACYPHNHKVSGIVESIILGMGHTFKPVGTVDEFINACKLQTGLELPLTGQHEKTDRFIVGTETIDNVLKFPAITNSYISASALGVTPSELLFYMTCFAVNDEPCLKVDVKQGYVTVELSAIYATVRTAVFNPKVIKEWRSKNFADYLEHFAPYKIVVLKGHRVQVPR